MPNTSGVIKPESAPMFFRMYCTDLKWIFYIYRLNRRCVLLGQPYYAVAKQPEPHVHMVHVPCDAQAQQLHQTWVQRHLHSSWHTEVLPKAGWGAGATPAPYTAPSGNATNPTIPKHSQGISLCTEVPLPRRPAGGGGIWECQNY